jgi:hypothetical protein
LDEAAAYRSGELNGAARRSQITGAQVRIELP